MRFAASTLFLLMTLAGCGSDTGGGGTSTTGGGTNTAADKAYCQGRYDRDVKCNNNPDATQIDMCVAGEACYRNLFTPSALEDFRTCIVARDCMTSEDSCLATADMAQAGTAATKAFGDACMPKLAECDGAGAPFSDDYCYGYNVLPDAVAEKMTACLSQACPMVADCLSGVYSAILDPCGGK